MMSGFKRLASKGVLEFRRIDLPDVIL